MRQQVRFANTTIFANSLNKFLFSFPKEKLSATFLEHDRSIRNETKSFTKKIIQIIRHNSYGTGGNYNNDVALLKIEGELKFDNVLRPVCMPQHGAHYAGQKGKIRPPQNTFR